MSRVLKDSGVIWLWKIPASRDVSKIFFMCEDVYAWWTPDTWNESYYWWDISRIASWKCQDCDIFDETKFITEEWLNNSSTKLIPKNTTLLAMTWATCWKTGFLRIKWCANQSVTSFVENKNKAYWRYLYYGLQTINTQIVLNKTWWAQGWINVEDCKNLKIPVPSLSEQQKIADYLDKKCSKIDEQKANYEKSIELLKEYKQSLITEAITKWLDKNVEMKDSGIDWIGDIPKHYEIRRVKYTWDYRNWLTYSPADLCWEEWTLVLRSSNIQWWKLDFEDNVYVSCKVDEDLIVRNWDILICSRNGSQKLIGKNAVISNLENTSFWAFMMIYRSYYVPKYMYYILNSNIFEYYKWMFLTTTVNQLTGGSFWNMKIPFCTDTKEQKQIADYLDKECSKIDKVIAYREQMIEKLDEYKKSLIYECVTGKKEIK